MAAIIRQILLTVLSVVLMTIPVAADTLFGKSPEVPAVPNGITDVGIIILRLDADRDGIDDDWERLYGLDPTNPLDSFLDHDGDGLQAVQEYQAGTNPLNADTDGDGASDSEELGSGTDPLNSESVSTSPIDSIEIVPSNIHLVMNPIVVQASRQLKVLATLENGTEIDITSSVGTDYSSSDTSVVSFDNGLVIATLPANVQSGSTTITAENNGKIATATVSVERFAPERVSQLYLGNLTNGITVSDLDASGNQLFVAARTLGVFVIDISIPESPVILNQISVGDARDVKAIGNLVYVANGPNNIEIIDRQTLSMTEVPGTTGASDLAVNSRYVFLACGASGLKIVDRNTLQVFTPSDPQLQTGINSVDVGENYGLAKKDSNRTLVIDIENINQVLVLGDSGALPNVVTDVLVSGALGFVSNYDQPIKIFNISGSNPPALVSEACIEESDPTVVCGAIAHDLALAGSFLFLADSYYVNAIPFFNISNPSAPTLASIIDLSAQPWGSLAILGIDVEGEYVYTCGYVGNAQFIQVARYIKNNDSGVIPPTVRIVSPIAGADAAEGRDLSILVDAADDFAVNSVDFLIDGVVVFTDSLAPYQYTYSVPLGVGPLTIGAKATDRGGNVTVADDVIVNVIEDALPEVEITAPANGSGAMEGTQVTVSASATDDFEITKVEFYANNLKFATDTTGTSFSAVYNVPFGSPGSTITYLAKATDDVDQIRYSTEVTINVTDDPPPVVTITAPTATTVDEGILLPITFTANDNISVSSTVLFVNGRQVKNYSGQQSEYQFNYLIPYGNSSITITASSWDNRSQKGDSAPKVINLNDIPSGPAKLSELSLPNAPNDLAAADNYAYLAMGTSGVTVVDITDPRSPTIKATIDTPGKANEIKVQGSYAYVADDTNGLQIINISSPESPQLAGSISTGAQALAIEISGNTAFVAGSPSLTSINITDPNNPTLLDSISGPTFHTIDILGNLALAGRPPFFMGQGGVIWTYDISDPQNLDDLGYISRLSFDLVLRDQFAFSAAGGMDIIDFSVPTSPQLESTLPLTGQTIGAVALSDDPALVATNEGIGIVDISNETNPQFESLLTLDLTDCPSSTGLEIQDDFAFKTCYGGSVPGKLFIARFRTPEDTAGIDPTVDITSPQNETSVEAGSTVTVFIEAEDDVDVSTVELLLDGNVVATDIVDPYEMNFTVPTGVPEITISARATDFGGNVGTSSDVLLYVTDSNLPPTVNVTLPSDPTTVLPGANVSVTVDANDDHDEIDFVEVRLNGVVVPPPDFSEPYGFTVTLPTQAGLNLLTASAYDTAGNSTHSTAVRIYVCATTTITGRTIDNAGDPAPNLRILFEGQQLAMTNGSGNFTATNVSVCSGQISVAASGELDTEFVTGRSASTTVVLGGTTNVGDIVVALLGVPFYPGPEFPVGTRPNSAAIADFDEDGHKDIVVANFGSNDVSVLLGTSSGLFLPERRFAVGSIPTSVIVEDLDDDQNIDIITANAGSDNISVLLGNGDGSFDLQSTFAVGDTPLSLASGHLDADGNVDIVTANGNSNNVSILLGNSNGTFDPQTVISTGNNPTSIAIGQLNDGDTHLDVVTANRGCRSAPEGQPCNFATTVSVHFGNGDGTFDPEEQFTVGNGPLAVAIGDLSGDGKSDIVTANEVSNNVSVLIAQSGGDFTLDGTYTAGQGPAAVAVANFDNDSNGHLDVLVSNQFSNDVSVFLGDGDGNLAAQTVFPTGQDPILGAVGDLNNDSLLDAVVANFDVNTIVILFGAAEIFDSQKRIASGALDSQPNSISSADVNEDDIVDLIYDHFGFGEIVIRTGNGDGTFNSPTIIDVGDDGTVATVITDYFNNDDYVDLAWGDLATGEVVVRLGNGDGTFDPEIRTGIGSGPFDVVAADFNGDEILDIVTGNNFISNTVTVLIGLGDGSFQDVVSYGTGVKPATVVVGNLDGINGLDIIVSNLDSNDVSVLINNGNGTFQTEQRIPMGTVPAEVVVAKFDGDENLDLATSNFGSVNISVRLGNGDGTFGPIKNFETEDSPGFLRAADLNDDTFIDLIAGGENHGFLMILAGDGNGNFAPVQRYNTGNTPTSTSISDLNGDDVLDLVTTNFYTEDISVLLHR